VLARSRQKEFAQLAMQGQDEWHRRPQIVLWSGFEELCICGKGDRLATTGANRHPGPGVATGSPDGAKAQSRMIKLTEPDIQIT
jgi:hypothetical protein